MNCLKCGKKLNKDAKFCPNCSAPVIVEKKEESGDKSFLIKLKDLIKNASVATKSILLLSLILIVTIILNIIFNVNLIGWLITIISLIIIGFLQIKITNNKMILGYLFTGIAVVVVTLAIIFTTDSIKTTNDFSNNINSKSSVVSEGVNLDDLGNIINGQYYFDDGTNVYYSSFDRSGYAHIYKRNIKSGSITTIFDGFGWSFVRYQDWLYFSGNEGKEIDATYNLFRIKTDGTGLEKINTSYCYNMNFYKKWIYYTKKDEWASTVSAVYRSSVDGSNEELIMSNIKDVSVIYSNKLYYLDQSGIIYNANPDGSNAKPIVSDTVSTFIIGQGKIIYVDDVYNIKTANVDGTNVKLIRETDNEYISNINSYKNNIFYLKYSSYFDETRYAYPYYLYNIKMDGSDDKMIYEGLSWGFYINIVNNKVYAQNYARDLTTTRLATIITSMDFNGNNIQELYR